eukprot:447150-Amphidinium_carterae.1
MRHPARNTQANGSERSIGLDKIECNWEAGTRQRSCGMSKRLELVAAPINVGYEQEGKGAKALALAKKVHMRQL